MNLMNATDRSIENSRGNENNKYKGKRIEILAPAGSYEGMKAAMNAGCDAVYIGGSSFGARAYANNLNDDILLRAIDEAHVRGKHLYLTVNTLLKEKELTGELYRFLEKLYLQGLDAVIVQDMGVLHFIHNNFPELPIHASTQTTLTMAEGANLLKDYGVTRLVTARELSLAEIKNIRSNTDMEIETFIHGALCYCYSGQCLMSSMIGGRSGNRGRCAQPCRMPYQFHSEGKKLSSDKEKYLLSPKDINTLSLIPELIDAGIDSFKIEGRMKRPEYAAAVAATYRKYVDLYEEIGREKYDNYLQSEEFTKDMIMLQDIYNRGGFSEGYGKSYNGKGMMSLSRPNHTGVNIGEVIKSKGGQLAISLKEDVNAQDVLEVFQGEEGHEFTVKDGHNKGEVLSTNAGKNQQKIKVGAPVYRTKNNVLMEHLAQEYLIQDLKLGISGYLYTKVGEKLMLTVSCDDCSVTAYHQEVQEAIKQPMTKEKLAAPLEKTGDTLYYFDSLTIDSEEHIFVPVVWLNEIRREALQLLSEARAESYRRVLTPSPFGSTDSSIPDAEGAVAGSHGTVLTQEKVPGMSVAIQQKQLGLVVAVQTEEQLRTALEYDEIEALYLELDTIDHNRIELLAEEVRSIGKKFYLVLPPICRHAQYLRLKKVLLGIIVRAEVHGFVVKNFEEIALLHSLMKDGAFDKEIILNYNMYTYNKEAKLFWKEQGVSHFTAPVELNYQELKGLGVEDSDLLVYGYLPLMTSAQCLFESTEGCKRCKDGKHAGHLTDRLGKKFYIQTNCNGCYNLIYNGQALSLLKYRQEIESLKPNRLRLDFTMENAVEMNKVLQSYVDGFYYNKREQQELTGYTTGHFKRGIE